MDNESKIWNFLIEKSKNPFGTAALMGNLFAESSLNPIKANGIKKLGMTNQEYTDNVDGGWSDFIHDGIAYGLAQWCFHTRKQGLLDKAIIENKSIGDIDLQLEYLWEELQKYKTAYNAVINAMDIRSASDVVMLKYEKPANTSETAKEKRANYAQQYFDKYAKNKITVNAARNVWEAMFNALKNEL